MRLGDVANSSAAAAGRPLDGVRILAAEQMQALPFATQLLARLGATVIKVEHPEHGESGRGALPAVADPQGRPMGATFLRNNLDKSSVGIDLKTDEGRELFLRLAATVDVVGENFKAGTMDRLGLGYEVLAERFPRLIYLSVSGFGNRDDSPYRSWPAYAMVPEAMSGLYDYSRRGDEAPRAVPAGALGDISSALFACIGVLAALRHREATGVGQYVDIAMLDSMMAMGDVVTNLWSLGQTDAVGPQIIMDSFRASDGWFVMQVAREHQFEALAGMLDRPEWTSDPRLSTRAGWGAHLDELIRPAVEGWAATRTRVEVCDELGRAGIPTGPCFTASEVVSDPHVRQRSMLVEMDLGADTGPVLVPGNPVKLSNMTEGPETRVPWVGEHTHHVLADELGLSADELAALVAAGVISPRDGEEWSAPSPPGGSAGP